MYTASFVFFFLGKTNLKSFLKKLSLKLVHCNNIVSCRQLTMVGWRRQGATRKVTRYGWLSRDVVKDDQQRVEMATGLGVSGTAIPIPIPIDDFSSSI
ncbi:hypothetical protein L6452_36841 [Arctium lappa]|uniref:Uncharacterized protein n=1 Tax=Arctium lappa TaxID=4217 RepID=A0ACB8Y1E6_ARCLA|nr:hypothetical protein L6452_36841 [Arctium lappa]